MRLRQHALMWCCVTVKIIAERQANICIPLSSWRPKTCAYQSTLGYSYSFMLNFHLQLTTGYNRSQKCVRQSLTSKWSKHSHLTSTERQEHRYHTCWTDVTQRVMGNTPFMALHVCPVILCGTLVYQHRIKLYSDNLVCMCIYIK